MAEQTVQIPPSEVSAATPPPERSPERRRARQLLLGHPWLLGTVILLGISVALVLWARTRPGYDPYGWLVWGNQTLHLALNTNGAPSWKPMPYLFTVPFALTGHFALWLWMVSAVALSLMGGVFAFRLADRLVGAPPERRWAGWAAGLFAAATLFGIQQYFHYILSVQSDPPLASLVLAAIDCQVRGRKRWGFWLWVLVALGRPESWPFLGLYAIWLWRTDPAMRRELVAGLALIPVLWFGIPAISSKSWFVAGDLAQKSPRALHQSKITGTIDRYLALHQTLVWFTAALGVGVSLLRRQKVVLLIAAGTVLWLLIEIAFVLHGWPGVPRYLFEPAATASVIGGVFIGRVIIDLPQLVARLSGRWRLPRPLLLANGAAVLVVGVVFVGLLPAARYALRTEHKDILHERIRTNEINALPVILARLGGKQRIYACGTPTTNVEYQSVMAWDLGTSTGPLWFKPRVEKKDPHTVVNFQAVPAGWKVFVLYPQYGSAAKCAGLNNAHYYWTN